MRQRTTTWLFVGFIAALAASACTEGSAESEIEGVSTEGATVVSLLAEQQGEVACVGLMLESGLIITAAHCSPLGTLPLWLDDAPLNVWTSKRYEAILFPPLGDVALLTALTRVPDDPEFVEVHGLGAEVWGVGSKYVLAATVQCPAEATEGIICFSHSIEDRELPISGSPVVVDGVAIGVATSNGDSLLWVSRLDFALR